MGRPKLKIPFQPIDYAIELLSVSLLLLMWLYIITEYDSLPQTIASHFNAKGDADAYASKSTIWLLPSIVTVLYVGLFILNKYPHLHNYMINITKENAFKNYSFSTRMLRIVNFFCVLLFAYIVYAEIQFSKGIIHSLGTWLFPSIMILSVISIIVFIYFQQKHN